MSGLARFRPLPCTYAQVRSVAVDRLGQWLATGSDDGTVRVWEVHNGRCAKARRPTHPLPQPACSPVWKKCHSEYFSASPAHCRPRN